MKELVIFVLLSANPQDARQLPVFWSAWSSMDVCQKMADQDNKNNDYTGIRHYFCREATVQ
jgi:hypothetical protein